MSPRVSIVIPTYNQADFLKECLDSVRAQTVADWECIVVNNFSADHTRDVVLAYGDPRIQLIDFANQGVIAASRNVGIRAARAEWVAFLDSDDLWAPNKLELCLAAVTDGVDLVSHPEHFLKDGAIVNRTQAAPAERCRFERLLLDGNCLSPSAVLVRRALLERAGGFCEDREVITAEDADLWLRLAALGARMTCIPQPVGYYRLHGEQNSKGVARHMEASLTVLERHLPALPGKGGWRGRRARARIVYGAARTEQKLGRGPAALSLLARSALLWPFQIRLLPAFLLSLRALPGPRA
ncbi:Glycosyltransferase [Magnetospirillum sp. XM-1]|uniref:glycosyltransferase family 2 protein n=1 Tax=Magnetospirillum sp. XM-1 TaxID=1663591 RepID=UPI00073DECB4|nr:glycosyltransferase [Magnetospirillum sp. XM-1]CUW38052.1 Glycosyltransferase [Magnetospirillum sp. XM-1]